MKKQIKVLAIGNSFSLDANRYLHSVAASRGADMKVVGLYIGGCPLHIHYKNINNDAKEYELDFNGTLTGFKVSIREALQNDLWDYVTVQQASHLSGCADSYQPYLDSLKEYIKLHAPQAEILVHQTWAYEDLSPRISNYYDTTRASEMFEMVRDAYAKAAKDLGNARIIPCGEVMYALSQKDLGPVHRDTYHANYGFARYALALTWDAVLCGADPRNNTFRNFDVEVTDEQIEVVRQTVYDIVFGA